MPLELGKVLEVPQVFRVEAALLGDHFLPIESECCHFGHSFICELDPSFPEAELLIASSFDPVFPAPL